MFAELYSDLCLFNPRVGRHFIGVVSLPSILSSWGLFASFALSFCLVRSMLAQKWRVFGSAGLFNLYLGMYFTGVLLFAVLLVFGLVFLEPLCPKLHERFHHEMEYFTIGCLFVSFMCALMFGHVLRRYHSFKDFFYEIGWLCIFLACFFAVLALSGVFSFVFVVVSLLPVLLWFYFARFRGMSMHMPFARVLVFCGVSFFFCMIPFLLELFFQTLDADDAIVELQSVRFGTL